MRLATAWMSVLSVLSMLCLAVVALVVLAEPSRADPRVVTLSQLGPSPTSVALLAGQVVRFRNDDSVPHTITSTSGNWTFHAVIPAAKTADTPPFRPSVPQTTSYGYTDRYAFERTVLIGRPGEISVSAAPSSPARPPATTTSSSPRAPGSAVPRASSSRSSSPSADPSGSATTTTTTTQTTRTGTALAPGIGSRVSMPTPSSIDGPQPNIAPVPASGEPQPRAAASTAAVAYSQRGLVQESSHRYGLPAALALLAVTGVASLLARLLLAQPPAGAEKG